MFLSDFSIRRPVAATVMIISLVVFGIIGLLLVIAAIAVERKLEDIKSWREVLDTWE